MSEVAIACEQIAKRYGSVYAVRDVSLALERGRLLALLGPSGCGKTTTLRLLAGFEAPDSGQVWIGEQLVAGQEVCIPPEQRRLGVVFQDYALFPHMNVARNIAYGLARGPEQAARVQEVLELVGLAGVEQRMPHELSGGQQQRVALARALAGRPKVVLLDEPFSNLDAGLRVRVRAEVREILARADATAVFVTHDQEEALSLADRVAVMLQGRLVQCGSPEEVYRRPASRQVGLFVGEANMLPAHALGDYAICELGRVPLTSSARGAVELLIRPEEIELRADGHGPGRVIERSFFGHDQAGSVQLPSGTVLRVRMGPEQPLQVGQRTRLAVRGPAIAFAAGETSEPAQLSA